MKLPSCGVSLLYAGFISLHVSLLEYPVVESSELYRLKVDLLGRHKR
jgi:hypothetical protein